MARRIILAARTPEDRRIIIGPTDFTKASILDALANNEKLVPTGSDSVAEWHSLYMMPDELGISNPFASPDMLTTLSSLYDCESLYAEQKRGRGLKPTNITWPVMNIIGGIQPSYLAQNVSEHLWGQGGLARFIMIYAEARRRDSMFISTKYSHMLESLLISDMSKIISLFGTVRLAPDAQIKLDELFKTNFSPRPTHPRLAHYNARRDFFLMKLATISSVSRGSTMMIEEVDVLRAVRWLHEAEVTMPLVFRSMGGDSDESVIEDLHEWAISEMRRTGEAIPRDRIRFFLSKKVRGFRIDPIVSLAIDCKYFEILDPGGQFVAPLNKPTL